MTILVLKLYSEIRENLADKQNVSMSYFVPCSSASYTNKIHEAFYLQAKYWRSDSNDTSGKILCGNRAIVWQ